MHKLVFLALVLLAAAVLAAWASGGTAHRGGPTSGSSIAEVADASTSWADFSSKVPNLQEALARESQQAILARARRAASSR
jgi:ABC-type phosphate transport system substrate-binding protein